MRRFLLIVVIAVSSCGVTFAQAPDRSGIAPEALADAKKALADYEARVAKLRGSSDANVKAFLPTAEYLCIGLRNFIDPAPWEAANGQPLIAPADDQRYAKVGRISFVKGIASELDKILPELEAGRNPYVKYSGSTLVAYRSSLDGRLLAVRMAIPAGYDPAKSYGLKYQNSSSSGVTGNAQRPLYIRYADSTRADVLSAVISDRGECNYGNDIHEQETVEALGELIRMFHVDPARIVKEGGSKDGYTSVSIAIHYPHLLAATFADTANSLPDGSIDSRPLPCYAPFRDQMNAFIMADNLYDLPSVIATGFDGDHLNTLTMGALLEKLNAPNKILRIVTEDGHGVSGRSYAEFGKWLPEQRLDPYPKRVYVSTSTLRYNKFYWVELDRLEHENRFARMRVDALAGNRIEVETHNVVRFSLVTLDKLVDAGKPVALEIDDQRLAPVMPAAGELHFARKDGKWAAAATRSDGGVVKKHGLAGPMMDGWIQPCLHVIGTLGGDEETARLREMMMTEVRFLRSETCGFRSMDHAVKLDTQVTAQDIRDRNLILWGSERTNRLIRDVNGKLPVRLDGNKVVVGSRSYEYDDVGLALIYPNPLNPERYVMVFSGNTWMAQEAGWISQWSDDKAVKTVNYFKIGNGYPMLPDYFIFRQNRKGLSPTWGATFANPATSVLEGGYFDADWKLTDDDAFAWRNPAPQTNAPLSVPKCVRPAVPARAIGASTDEKPPVMTATPGTLKLGAAEEKDGLLYHFSAAHRGRFFYREFGSVFTSPEKLIVLEVRVTNKSAGKAFVYPALKTEDAPALELAGKQVKPFALRTEQAFPATDPGEGFRIVFLYRADAAKADKLVVKGVGLKKDLALSLSGADLVDGDYNPDRLTEGATW